MGKNTRRSPHLPFLIVCLFSVFFSPVCPLTVCKRVPIGWLLFKCILNWWVHHWVIVGDCYLECWKGGVLRNIMSFGGRAFL